LKDLICLEVLPRALNFKYWTQGKAPQGFPARHNRW